MPSILPVSDLRNERSLLQMGRGWLSLDELNRLWGITLDEIKD